MIDFEANEEGLLFFHEKEFNVLLDTEEGSPAEILVQFSSLLEDIKEQERDLGGHVSVLDGVNNKSALYKNAPYSKIYYMETQSFDSYKFSMWYHNKPDVNGWLFGEDGDVLIDRITKSFLGK